ncbi:MAG: hypothetical protein PVG09_06305 [Thiohalocapsa sp.]|jgi:hypothetical protein
MPPRQPVIEDHDGIGASQGEQQNGRLSGTEIRNQTDDLFARWGAHVSPRQRLRHGHIDPTAPTFGQLGRDRGGHDDLPVS